MFTVTYTLELFGEHQTAVPTKSRNQYLHPGWEKHHLPECLTFHATHTSARGGAPPCDAYICLSPKPTLAHKGHWTGASTGPTTKTKTNIPLMNENPYEWCINPTKTTSPCRAINQDYIPICLMEHLHWSFSIPEFLVVKSQWVCYWKTRFLMVF